MRKITILCVALPFLLLLTACGKRTYTVTYQSDSHGRIEIQTVDEGSCLTPPRPIREGYTLDGWDVATTSADEGESFRAWNLATDTVSGDITLYARWKLLDRTVTFDADGGDAIAPKTVEYGQPFDLPTPTRRGFTFVGWYRDGERVESPACWEGSPVGSRPMTYTARWSVTFGAYEQDNRLDNGKEPIEWLVIAERDGNLLLLSRFILDAQPLQSVFVNTGLPSYLQMQWKDSTLRPWLNNEFLYAAFSENERAAIRLTPLRDTDTEDRVFLLNWEELESAKLSAEQGRGRGTPYARAQGLIVCNGVPATASYWWLRTGGTGPHAYDDQFREFFLGKSREGVRPAIWVDAQALAGG